MKAQNARMKQMKAHKAKMKNAHKGKKSKNDPRPGAVKFIM